jgi:hypothetical protein
MFVTSSVTSDGLKAPPQGTPSTTKRNASASREWGALPVCRAESVAEGTRRGTGYGRDAEVIDAHTLRKHFRAAFEKQTDGIEMLAIELPCSNEQYARRRHEHGRCIGLEQPLALWAVERSHVHAVRFGDVVQKVPAIGKELRESLSGLRSLRRPAGKKSDLPQPPARD